MLAASRQPITRDDNGYLPPRDEYEELFRRARDPTGGHPCEHCTTPRLVLDGLAPCPQRACRFSTSRGTLLADHVRTAHPHPGFRVCRWCPVLPGDDIDSPPGGLLFCEDCISFRREPLFMPGTPAPLPLISSRWPPYSVPLVYNGAVDEFRLHDLLGAQQREHAQVSAAHPARLRRRFSLPSTHPNVPGFDIRCSRCGAREAAHLRLPCAAMLTLHTDRLLHADPLLSFEEHFYGQEISNCSEEEFDGGSRMVDDEVV